MLTAELGGGAGLSREGQAIAEQGRVLQRYGLLSAQPSIHPRQRVSCGSGQGAFVYAMRKKLFEPAEEVGAVVQAGELAGVVHAIDRPWQAPEPVSFTESGMVACRRAPMLTDPGDCLYKPLVDLDPG